MLKLLRIVGLCGGVSAFAPNNTIVSIKDVPYDKSRITRQLTSVTVSNFDSLKAALQGSATEIILADGTHALTSTLRIIRDVTIRAENSGQATLDGGNNDRVMQINSGTVVLEGLHITKGKTFVCPPCLS